MLGFSRQVLIVLILSFLMVSWASVPQTQTSQRGMRLPVVDLNALVLKAVQRMPKGGGYATSRKALNRLCFEAITHDKVRQNLRLRPDRAKPSFCSSACYMVFLLTLRHWEQAIQMRLPEDVWLYLAPSPEQHDGKGAWGRANANGPGLAKWAHDLGFGINFTDITKAKPGDFLKIFWTTEIGAREFGHFVVFLGCTRESATGETKIKFWSSNMNEGYGCKEVPLSSCKRMIFTRLTQPARLTRWKHLPEVDTWLQSLLNKRVSERNMLKACGISNRRP